MKNNKILIILGILLINVLVFYTISQNMMGKASDYEIAVAQAREFSEKQLYSRALTEYENASFLEDSPELQLEIIDTYKKGLECGELKGKYSTFSKLIDIVNAYPKNVAFYDSVCPLLLSYEKYEDCTDLLIQAQELNLQSETLMQVVEQIRYKYVKNYSMFVEVQPEFNGMYVAKTENSYVYLDNFGRNALDYHFLSVSDFGEGYAFAQIYATDGSVKSVILDQEGQRQAYLENVEASSGVGAAKDEQGQPLYLLSCKSGDRYSYYNIDGEKVFGDYQFAGRFRNNVAAVMISEGKWQLINGQGKPIVDQYFTDVVLNEADECAPKGRIFAQDGHKYYIYTHKGERIDNFSCDGAKAFVDDYAAFRRGDQWGFVNQQGEVVIQPQYEDAKSFSNQLGSVWNGEGWVFISPQNEIVIEEVFVDVGYLSDSGICFVKTDEYWSYLQMYYTGQ